jgi:hypothetical protein
LILKILRDFLFLFLFLFFFHFILQHWIYWILNFITYFNLFSMKVSQPHNSGHEFLCLLFSRVNSSYFFIIFNYFFSTSSFNIELIENWDSYFFFNFLSTRLPWSHASGREFCELVKLTQVFLILYLNWFFFNFILHNFFFLSTWLSWSYDLGHELGSFTRGGFVLFNYFVFQFHHLLLGWLEIRLHNLFWFGFYEVILVSWSDRVYLSMVVVIFQNVFHSKKF